MFYSICPWRVCAHALQAAPKEIATVRWQIRQTHLQLKRIVKIRLWWWSSYQHARLTYTLTIQVTILLKSTIFL